MGKSIRNIAVVTRVGLDLAKNAFQVHAVDAKGEVVVARKLARRRLVAFFSELPRCVVAMEACSLAHHWGRALSELGHEIKLIPPAHVKPQGITMEFMEFREFRELQGINRELGKFIGNFL